ncbi:MAG: hypothetical protein JW917_07690 [Ignavibacteria bacterium]|nr:hypothetical protein [Ignavibacteria bacterium]
MKKSGFLLLLLIFFVPDTYAQNDITFLFDNSGSMLGYYADPSSSFKIFSKALMRNTVGENDNVKVYLFNKTEEYRGLLSPQLLYNGKGSGLIADKIIAAFSNVKGRDNYYANTDMIEALDKAISGIRGGKGVIWLITDNINDNIGTGDSSFLNTLDFYRKLRTDQNIRKILLYPIPEKLSGINYLSYGYVIYGIVYSYTILTQPELEEYNEYFKSSGIKQKPLTLKPLDIGTIVLYPKKTQGMVSPGKIYFDGNSLRGFGFEENERVKEIFPDVVLKSNLFPYTIKSARLNVRLENFISSDYSVKSLGTQTINPSVVNNVSPEGEVTGFSVTFNMPEISPNFSFNTIFKQDFTVGGNLILEVSNVDIALDEKYMENFKDLFALGTVPEIFQPVLKDKKIQSKIPLEIRINYGQWRLFVLIGLIILFFAVLIVFLIFLTKKKGYNLKINDANEQTVFISVMSPYYLFVLDSPGLGKLKRTLSGRLKFAFSKSTISPNKVITVSEGIPVEIEYGESGKDSITLTVVSAAKDKSRSGEAESELEKYY